MKHVQHLQYKTLFFSTIHLTDQRKKLPLLAAFTSPKSREFYLADSAALNMSASPNEGLTLEHNVAGRWAGTFCSRFPYTNRRVGRASAADRFISVSPPPDERERKSRIRAGRTKRDLMDIRLHMCNPNMDVSAMCTMLLFRHSERVVFVS